MPEIEGSNRGILLPNIVMELGISVNADNPKFCRLQRGNIHCAYMNVVFVKPGGRPLPLEITPDGWQELAQEHSADRTVDRSWYCVLFRKILCSQKALTSIPRCQECLDAEVRCRQAAAINYNNRNTRNHP